MGDGVTTYDPKIKYDHIHADINYKNFYKQLIKKSYL